LGATSLAIPVVDALVVMSGRLLKKKSIFVADCEHLHHIFQLAKVSDKSALLIIDVLAFSLLLLGLVLASYGEQYRFVVF
jgi:UDP-N-acetylmuramyl pentapeptide phosphotransferase/UDP-N-acetylglucosamine-1-phosphate transferase